MNAITPIPWDEKPIEHAPGIYFGMPEAEYRADPALGSTDKKVLLGDAASFWWRSPMNPVREEENDDTPAKTRGRAVHKFVLEGRDAFEARYGRCEHKGNVKAGMVERDAFRADGLEPIAGKDYDRIMAAGTMIRSNPSIASAFSGGMPEVSVFWETEVDGEIVRQKARFDYLKPRAIPDLKSHAPMDGLPFKVSCRRAIKTYRYPLQAGSYLDARCKFADFFSAGAVFGDHDPAWMKSVAEASAFAFVLCFWASEGAPLTWGCVLSPNNPLIREAEADIAVALRRYVDFRREFGTNQAWIRPEPLEEAEPDEVKNWFYYNAA